MPGSQRLRAGLRNVRAMTALAPPRPIVALALCCAVGCGARTGLLVEDDASVDASVRDATADVADVQEVPDGMVTCIPGRFMLERFSVDLMLVIDRSNSMAYNIDGTTHYPPRKWDDLHDALAATLPGIQSTVNIGAYAFPERFRGTLDHPCGIDTAIDVFPGLNQAGDVLALFGNTDPYGNTPTDAAIQLVGDMLVPRVSRTHTEVMVLATDGGPNCNGTLDPMACSCVDPSLSPCIADECLDDGRTANTIASYAAQGVPTYVIGLDSATLPDERTALSEMALAGGRPNTTRGEPAYYSAQHVDEVNAAFASITRSIAQCTLATPSRPSDPGAIEVQIDGVTIPRDPTHTNGWDWNDPSFGQIALFGAACDGLANPTASAVALVHSCVDAAL
jgi:hypothetical protein